MIRHNKETDTLDLGEVVGPGLKLNLVLEPNQYQRPPDCSCGRRYIGHGREYPQLPQALASWRPLYFRQRYFHPSTGKCDQDGESLRIGPARLVEWARPLLQSLYVLGLSDAMVSHLFPKGAVSFATVWRRVRHLDPTELAIHEELHNRLLHDLNRWDRKGQKKNISEFFTIRVIDPPDAGLEVEAGRPIHQLTKRWIERCALTSQQHPTQGNLSLHLV